MYIFYKHERTNVTKTKTKTKTKSKTNYVLIRF